MTDDRFSPMLSSTPHLAERFALWHAASMVLLSTWALGGNSDWAHTLISGWGSLSILVFCLGVFERWRQPGACRRIIWLWPWAAFNLVVLLSLANPNLRAITGYGATGFIPGGEHPWLPSCARPDQAIQALWLFDALFLTAFNVAFLVRRRTALRRLLLFVAGNATALAIFGSLQKLAGAEGLFFGAIASPNPTFFASFIYHNHWGPVALLAVAVCLGLVWHHARNAHQDYRDAWHSPTAMWLVATLLLAASIPLSTSRSCTLLLLVLLAGAWLHWSWKRVRHAGRSPRRTLAVWGGGSLLAVGTVGLVYWLGQPIIEARVEKTREQLTAAHARGNLLGSRSQLYQDTWRMAQEKPWFGWGMASYPTVFSRYNTQTSPLDRLPVVYVDAHNDWLQSLAEHGVVGTVLLAMLGVLPLWQLRRYPGTWTLLPRYLLGGCALILIYALVEFPFGSQAIVYLWWLCFFVAVRYRQLEALAH